ncbi:MAG: hypothetical protein IKA32_07665 [Lentisphaeria bacterium]|nr:hypothetical protein [Lentisphaeria bacterium]
MEDPHYEYYRTFFVDKDQAQIHKLALMFYRQHYKDALERVKQQNGDKDFTIHGLEMAVRQADKEIERFNIAMKGFLK